jgi:iron complex transport system permease protein
MKRFLIPILLVALAAFAGLSLVVGRVIVPFDAWFSSGDPRWAIIAELRVPRTLLAMLIGAALGVSGAAMQGYTRNPLADPGILGVSAMAAFGAVLTIYFGLTAGAIWILPTAAIAGALCGVAILLSLSGIGASTVTFVLAGVILQSVAGAAVALALSLAPDPWATQEIIDWLIGSLTDRSMDEVTLATPFIGVGIALLLALQKPLSALSLGEDGARSLGVNLPLTQAMLAVGVGLATGASVAVSGIVSFVGLIVPHIVRGMIGSQPGRLLIPSALGGAVLVLAADMLVRLTPAAAEIKLGVALSALGGPFFLAMLISMRRRMQ